jgi:hypothetical protein
MDLRVERPVRNVKALDRVDEGRDRQLPWRKPPAPPPSTDVVANAAGIDSKWQHTLRADRRSDFLVVHQRGRSAELTVLPHASGIEDHDRATRLTLNAAARGLPPSLFFGKLAQRLHQIELDDVPVLTIDLIRRLGAAERAEQLLRGRIPLRLSTARRALVLFECENLTRQDM